MNLDTILNNVFLINLEKDINRYNNSILELSKLNISNLSVVKAIKYDDERVKTLYRNNLVKRFDSCFRCDDINYKLRVCTHENNIITPPQVANFLSFKKVMELSTSGEKLFMVLEDDFYLTNNYLKAFKNIKNFCVKNDILNSPYPVLVRLGSHTVAEKRYQLRFKLFKQNSFIRDKYNMANPAFIYNDKFAKLFVNKFKKIETTSDNFIHKYLCIENKVINYSVLPFPISQHTHRSQTNFFTSNIDKSDDNIFFKNRVVNDVEYADLLQKWIY